MWIEGAAEVQPPLCGSGEYDRRLHAPTAQFPDARDLQSPAPILRRGAAGDYQQLPLLPSLRPRFQAVPSLRCAGRRGGASRPHRWEAAARLWADDRRSKRRCYQPCHMGLSIRCALPAAVIALLRLGVVEHDSDYSRRRHHPVGLGEHRPPDRPSFHSLEGLPVGTYFPTEGRAVQRRRPNLDGNSQTYC